MLSRAILIIVVAAMSLSSCVSTIPNQASKKARFDPSLRLTLPCRAEAKLVMGIWYINVDRTPNQPEDQPKKFASGAFDARVPVWVTFEGGQQLVTVAIDANEDGARVDSGSVSTGLMITGQKIRDVDNPTKCEAFTTPF